MEKAANVSLERVIDRICNHLNCRVEKAIEHIKESEGETTKQRKKSFT